MPRKGHPVKIPHTENESSDSEWKNLQMSLQDDLDILGDIIKAKMQTKMKNKIGNSKKNKQKQNGLQSRVGCLIFM